MRWNLVCKAACVLLTLVMLSALFAGCGDTASSSAASGGAQTSTGGGGDSGAPVEINIVARKLVDAFEDNVILHEMEERLGIKLNYTWKPSEDYTSQCSLLIASGDYPDMMEYWCTTFPVEIEQLATDGVILPLDDLLDKHGKNIMSTFPEQQFYRQDGRTYSMPCRNLEIGLDELYVVRQDWLDNLGLQAPTTLDELYDVLKAFKEQDANGNGDPNDEIPWGYASVGGGTVDPLNLICSNYDVLYSYWGYGWNETDDGDLQYYLEMPAFKEALAFNRRLYQEGLIEPEYSILTRDTYMEKRNADKYGVEGWWFTELDPAIATWASDFYTAVPQAKFTSIKMFPGPDGVPQFTANFEKPASIVFSHTEYPEECVKLIDFLASQEGNDLAVMGIKGEHWNEENGVITQNTFTDSEVKQIGFNLYKWLCLPRYVPRSTTPEYLEFVDYPEGTIVWQPTYAPEEKLKYFTELQNIFVSGRDKLVTTPGIDFDAEFDAFVNTWKESGGDAYTEAMNRMHKEQQ